MGAHEKALLGDKYGWTGEKYRGLMSKIVQENYSKISNVVLTTDKRRFKKDVQNLLPKKQEKNVVLPDVSNVIRRSPTIRKAADQGKLMEKNMREEMRKLVKRGLLAQNITTTTGAVRASTARGIEKELNTFFEGYVKKDPLYKMPRNVHSIAVTEAGAAINQIRHEYLGKARDDNKELVDVIKTWIHNRSRSKEPRKGHEAIDGQKRKFDEKFDVPMYRKKNGRMAKVGTAKADHPHDPNLPAEEVITCHCFAKYKIVKKTIAK